MEGGVVVTVRMYLRPRTCGTGQGQRSGRGEKGRGGRGVGGWVRGGEGGGIAGKAF